MALCLVTKMVNADGYQRSPQILKFKYGTVAQEVAERPSGRRSILCRVVDAAKEISMSMKRITAAGGGNVVCRQRVVRWTARGLTSTAAQYAGVRLRPGYSE